MDTILSIRTPHVKSAVTVTPRILIWFIHSMADPLIVIAAAEVMPFFLTVINISFVFKLLVLSFWPIRVPGSFWCNVERDGWLFLRPGKGCFPFLHTFLNCSSPLGFLCRCRHLSL